MSEITDKQAAEFMDELAKQGLLIKVGQFGWQMPQAAREFIRQLPDEPTDTTNGAMIAVLKTILAEFEKAEK